MKIITRYKCDHCCKVFESESQCLLHEQNCLLNNDAWELRWFTCNCKTGKFDGTDIPICSDARCNMNEHCDGKTVFRVNKLTGEINR